MVIRKMLQNVENFKCKLADLLPKAPGAKKRKGNTHGMNAHRNLPGDIDAVIVDYIIKTGVANSNPLHGYVDELLLLQCIYHIVVVENIVGLVLDWSRVLIKFCLLYPTGELNTAVEVLCRLGANPNCPDDARQRPNALFALLENTAYLSKNLLNGGASQVVAVLVRHGLDIQRVDAARRNALWKAATCSFSTHAFTIVSRAVLESGIKINYSPSSRPGNVLLHFLWDRRHHAAQWCGKRAAALHELVKQFVDFKVAVNAVYGCHGDNLLTLLAKTGASFDTFTLLIGAGIDVHHRNAAGMNVVDVLCENAVGYCIPHAIRVIRLMVDLGVNVRDQDEFRSNALDTFLCSVDRVTQPALDLVTLLVDAGSELNYHAPGGMDELCRLVLDRTDLPLNEVHLMARHLLQLARSRSTRAPRPNGLLLALIDDRMAKRAICDRRLSVEQFGRVSYDVIQLLLEHGSDPNARLSPDDETPLAVLCRRYAGANLPEIVELLLANGANPSVTCSSCPFSCGNANCKRKQDNNTIDMDLLDLLARNTLQSGHVKSAVLKTFINHGVNVPENHRHWLLATVLNESGFSNVIKLIESKYRGF